MAFHEIRQYSIKPGKMADWVKLFDEEIMPFQVSKGVVVAGSFRGEEDDSVFIWMRRFDPRNSASASMRRFMKTRTGKRKSPPALPN